MPATRLWQFGTFKEPVLRTVSFTDQLFAFGCGVRRPIAMDDKRFLP